MKYNPYFTYNIAKKGVHIYFVDKNRDEFYN